MYLLFVDESGTHPGPHPFVLGGFAIHEDDAARLQKELDDLVVEHLGRVPPNLDEYEIHGSEMRNAKKPRATSRGAASIWANVPRETRLSILDGAHKVIADFTPSSPDLPMYLFGVAVERDFRPDWSELETERWAYEVLLSKFDVMLKTRRLQGYPNRGLVIHDRRVVAERDIQSWVASWRSTAERIGQLRNLADVPLFGDSRATRLLQVADLVSYAVFRNYNQAAPNASGFDALWRRFHREGTTLHGLVHYTPNYGKGSCTCEPCAQRLIAEAGQSNGRARRARKSHLRG